jgi:hypothetical protein
MVRMRRSATVAFYRAAQELVRASGFAPEVEWFSKGISRQVTAQDFMRESAWVILCSGFREEVVRTRFDYISLCFWDFTSARRIARDAENCVTLAMERFANRPKLLGIAQIAKYVSRVSFGDLWQRIITDPSATLQMFPFIGPATSLHLAKNLGISVAKPDRHLNLLARELRFSSTFELCEHFSRLTTTPVAVVDTVLWRAAVIAGSAGALVDRLLVGPRVSVSDT